MFRTRSGRLAIATALLVALGSGAAGANPTLLIEADTGRVLHAEDATRPWYPASITKLMTTYVALSQMREGRARPETLLTYSALAEAQEPSKMGFKVGTQFTLENALRMLMVKSANDVAVAIAEGLGGSVEGFAAEMNRHARRLGMTGSRWVNPHGLPDTDQFTTARDMAILARALLREFPQAHALFRIPGIKLGKIHMRNHNALLRRYPGADGMKTGFICAGGFNIVATASRNGKRLIAVVLGANSGAERSEIAAGLFNNGFQPAVRLFSTPPQVEALENTGGAPTDMRDLVCGRGRPRPTESDDDNANFAASSGDPSGVYATIHADKGGHNGRKRSSQNAASRPTNLSDQTVGPPLPVYTGPARGDTILAGIAPPKAGSSVAGTPPSDPPPQAAARKRPAPGQIAAPQTQRPGSVARPEQQPDADSASAYAPAMATGGFQGAIPVPRPRPRR